MCVYLHSTTHGIIESPSIRYSHYSQRSLDIEVIVARNAGGRAEYAVRDILTLSSLFNLTDIVVVHHTGTLTFPSSILRLLTSRGLTSISLTCQLIT